MSKPPSSTEIQSLFVNRNPDEVWAKAEDIIRRINPAHDFALARMVFDDTVRMFHGKYPGYCSIKTLYHDLSHTMDVFMCASRLMHGMHVSGTPLADHEINMIMIAALLHDIGYVQRQGEETGTGAQYTASHVSRGIAFMQHYLTERQIPPGFAANIELMMLSTDPKLVFSEISFPDARTRLLAKIVGTSDLVGQMADRSYLEKLLFLYLEFKEANIGNFQNIHDMLRKSIGFYEVTRAQKLDEAFEGIYSKLAFHFKEFFGVAQNYYLDAIEKNMAYLSKIISLNEEEYLSMLKRGGIAEKAQTLDES